MNPCLIEYFVGPLKYMLISCNSNLYKGVTPLLACIGHLLPSRAPNDLFEKKSQP